MFLSSVAPHYAATTDNSYQERLVLCQVADSKRAGIGGACERRQRKGDRAAD
jgi:hypothetical protein